MQSTHPTPRKYLELTQDVIVVGLCLLLFVGMGIKLFHLGQAIAQGVDFALVVGDILFILDEVQSGQFARELVEEFDGGQVNHLKYREELGNHPIEQTGAKLRPMMSWLND